MCDWQGCAKFCCWVELKWATVFMYEENLNCCKRWAAWAELTICDADNRAKKPNSCQFCSCVPSLKSVSKSVSISKKIRGAALLNQLTEMLQSLSYESLNTTCRIASHMNPFECFCANCMLRCSQGHTDKSHRSTHTPSTLLFLSKHSLRHNEWACQWCGLTFCHKERVYADRASSCPFTYNTQTQQLSGFVLFP